MKSSNLNSKKENQNSKENQIQSFEIDNSIISKKELKLLKDNQSIKELSKKRFIDISDISDQLKKEINFFDKFSKSESKYFISKKSNNDKFSNENEILSMKISKKRDNRINDYYYSLISFKLNSESKMIEKKSFNKLSKSIIREMNEKEIQSFDKLMNDYKIQENNKKIDSLKKESQSK